MPDVTVLPLTLPVVHHPDAHTLLYPHQAVMLDQWEQHDSFLVVTKTGTGKTIAGILPVLKHGQRAICVYPTNELIRDQIRNIAGIAEAEGLTVCVQAPDTTAREYSAANLILVHIDALALEQWCGKKHYKAKWRALRDLLEPDKPKIVLTNPDILFLIFALRYHGEALATLQGYDALIADEFHLYAGVELAHALYMLHAGRSLDSFRKIVLLSATPPPETEEYLRRILGEPFIVDTTTECAHEVVGRREAVQQIDVIPRLAGLDVVEIAVRTVKDLTHQIVHRRSRDPGAAYVPAVVVLNSVVNAIRLEDRLVEAGFRREDLAIIRGLSPRQARDTTDKLIAIGTSAIEVGIDFKCDFLIFEASEAASFMQRFGRVGRHTPGMAYVLCKSNVVAGIEALPRQIERGEFEARVYNWYPVQETRPWFAASFFGLLSAFSMTENLIKRVWENRKKPNPTQLAAIEARMEEIEAAYSQRLGCSDALLRRTQAHLRRMRKGDEDYQWLAAYRDLNAFRTSLPSEWVLDFAERDRRGGDWNSAKYTADVATLLRRADGLRYIETIPHPEDSLGMLTVKGYGRYRRVWVNLSFTDDDCGIPRRTSEFSDLRFIQEGHKTPVSHVMTLRDHVFVVVPRNVAPDLDWRLPVFDCGKHLIAFDGTALLLCEIYNRRNAS